MDLQRLAAGHDAHAFLAGLREHSPVHHERERNVWVISRRAEAMQVLRTPAVFSAHVASFENTLLGADGPRHQQIRRALAAAVAGPSSTWLQADVARNAERLVHAFCARDSGEAVEDIANALTMTMSSTLIGLAEPPLNELRTWSSAVLHLGDPWLSAADIDNLQRLAAAFRGFIERHIETLDGSGENEVVRILAGYGAGQSLTPQERADIAMLLLVAGNETTTSLIGHTLAFLVRSDAVAASLAEQPALIDPFIQEVARLQSPVQRVLRVTTAESELAGVRIPPGAIVEINLASANRDESVFAAADTFDPQRDGPDHLSFGFGTHFCLGARLAQMQTRAVVQFYLAHLRGWACVISADPKVSFVVNKAERLSMTAPAPVS